VSYFIISPFKSLGEHSGLEVDKYFLISRASAVALSTVLWLELRKYRKWPFSAADRIKNFEPINTKISEMDNVIEVTKCAKYYQHRSSGLVSAYG
jgi:hypothetical protein